MPTRLLLATLLGVTLSARAQTADTLLISPPLSQGCPVGLVAQRTAAGRVAYANTDPQAVKQSVFVRFQQLDTLGLTAATLTAHGTNAGSRALPAAPAASASAAETFHLRRAADKFSLRHARLDPRDLVSVSWIELTEIHYTDGTAWHSAAGSRCIAEPNGLLLLSAR